MIEKPQEQAWETASNRLLSHSVIAIARDNFRIFPVAFCIAILLLLLSGLLEGMGILMLLPALDILLGEGTPTSEVTRLFLQAFAYFGLPLTLVTVIIVMIALITLKSALLFAARLYVMNLTTGLTKDFRLELIESLMRARWRYFTSESIGKLTNSIQLEAEQAATSANALFLIGSYTIQVTIYLVSAFVISWQLTLAAIAAGVAIMLLLRFFIEVTRRQGARATQLNRSFMSQIIEWLQNIKPLKAMGREDRVRPLLEQDTHGLMTTQRKLNLASQALINMQEPISAVFIGLGVIVAVNHFEVTLPSLLVMVGVFARSVGRISGIQKSFKKMARLEAPYFAFKSKLATVTAEAEAVGPGTADATLPRFTTTIDFDHVDFAYDEKAILRGLCLTIKAGRITAIVGRSGAGKSTLLDLLTGLLPPDRGHILVDGADLASLNILGWRQRIGYVPQETILFHASIRDNLTLGDGSISDDAVEETLRAVDAWDFVRAMDQGMHTIVGERGLKLSGGQRQRLAIARALMHRPSLLLLDEATSALDQETEWAILTMLPRLTPEVTVVAISHRPAFEEVADVVYRMEHGQVSPLSPTDAVRTVSGQGAAVGSGVGGS